MMNWMRLLGLFPLTAFILFAIPYIVILIFLFLAMLLPLYIIDWCANLYHKAVKW